MKHKLPAVTLFTVLVFIVALNLRPIMAAMGPLFPLLQRNMQLNGIQLSLLTMLPVLMMGLAALSGPFLTKKYSEVRGVNVGLILLIVGCAARGITPSTVILIASALLAGAGIGLIQAMMPALIKRAYAKHASTLMALFSTGIMAGAALAAMTAAPLASGITLRVALVIPVIPALFAFLIWKVMPCDVKTHKPEQRVSPPSSGQPWLLMVFFGIGTGAYTLVLAWLPPFYIQHGWQPQQSGYLLGVLTLTEVAAGFLLSSTIHYFQDRRPLLFLVLVLILSGLICLMVSGDSYAWLSTILLGLGIGALFPLSLIVTLDRAKTPEHAGALLSFVQGGGYMIASLMPLLAGIVRDQADSLNTAWAVMSLGIVILMIIALRFVPVKTTLP